MKVLFQHIFSWSILARIFCICHHCGLSASSANLATHTTVPNTCLYMVKKILYSYAKKNNTILSKWIPQLKKTLIGVLFMIEARPGHASWCYLRKDSTLPILNHDVNWWTDSDKASTENMIDKFIALSTRKYINIEISRNISSIYKKKQHWFYLN